MLVMAVPVMIYGGYQMVGRPSGLPYAYLPMTNQQVWDVTQAGYDWQKNTSSGTALHAYMTRPASVFPEPSDLGYFSLWLVCIGLASVKGRLDKALLVLGSAGLLMSQSLGAVIGAACILVVYAAKKRRIRRYIEASAVVLGVVAAAYWWRSDSFRPFLSRLSAASSLDVSADSGRITMVPYLLGVIAEAPILGHGLSSTAIVTPNGAGGLGYLALAVERGLVGTLLFLAPYVWAFGVLVFRRIRFESPAMETAILLSVVNLYNFASFAKLYFLPLWLALGITLWAAKRAGGLFGRSCRA
jgi:hypothetical protein